jgi:ribosomal protein S14
MKFNKRFYKYSLIRKSFSNKESNVQSLKLLIRLNPLNFLEALNNFSKIKKNSYKNNINNTCVVSLRSKSVIVKRVRLSRIKLKELANNGLLIGLKKYSW